MSNSSHFKIIFVGAFMLIILAWVLKNAKDPTYNNPDVNQSTEFKKTLLSMDEFILNREGTTSNELIGNFVDTAVLNKDKKLIEFYSGNVIYSAPLDDYNFDTLEFKGSDRIYLNLHDGYFLFVPTDEAKFVLFSLNIPFKDNKTFNF